MSPGHGDTLYLYLAASEIAVSAALFKECEDAKLRPIFFIRKSLTDVETRYTHLELVALALRTTAGKLRPYFQAHPIVVLTDLPLRGTIHKPDLSGRMARWEMELSEYGIQYKPRLSKKGQVLADSLQNSRSPTHARVAKAGEPSALMGPPGSQEPISAYS